MNVALACAHREALKSAEQFRLGAAVLRRRAVLATGRNRNINACGLSSIHAEMDALWRLPGNNTKDVHLVVVRVMRDGQATGMAKPCPACQRALARVGVRKVTYTTGDHANPLATVHFASAARTFV